MLTGALVREVRDANKLSRNAFMKLSGLPGKSAARLSNIETHESWKPGDRELVAAALNQLQPNFDPRYHASAVTTPTIVNTTSGDGPAVYLAFADEPPIDPEEEFVTLITYPPVTNLESAPVPPVALVTVPDELEEEFADVLAQENLEFPSVDEVAQPASLLIDDGRYAVSNSELQTFKRCRRKWWFAFYRGLDLQTQTFVGARSIGDRIHRALQHWYVPEGTTRVDPRDALERVIVEDWTKIATLAREREHGEEQLTNLAAEFGRATNLERAMVEGYVQWLGETGADADLRITASETALEVPVEVVVNGETRDAKFIGKLDVRARRVTDNVRLFLDHKTVGDLKGPAVTLPQNEQMLHYLLLEFLQTDDAESRCDGALYNMLKRSKRTARAVPPFYDRVEVRHNAYELASYRRRALAATANVMDAVDRLDRGDLHLEVVYPTPKADCRWDCDFFAVCNLFDDGSKGAEDMVNVLYRKTDPLERYQETKGKEQ